MVSCVTSPRRKAVGSSGTEAGLLSSSPSVVSSSSLLAAELRLSAGLRLRLAAGLRLLAAAGIYKMIYLVGVTIFFRVYTF